MIIGNTKEFAIEYEIRVAYERLSLRGLGFFVIHASGHSYGVKSANSTMLACSFDAVQRRLTDRGKHTAPFAEYPDAGRIADSVTRALYAEGEESEPLLGIPRSDFADLIYSNRIIWAPDGDEAFDDGSRVLQFDVGESVRLIGFRTRSGRHDRQSLTDTWMTATTFYSVLDEWLRMFEAEWKAKSKTSLDLNTD